VEAALAVYRRLSAAAQLTSGDRTE
jgi:hypothetical protein